MIQFEKENELNEKINKLKKVTRILSIIRLILALNAIIWLIVGLSYVGIYVLVAAISALVLILAFVFTNKYYNDLSLALKKSDVYLSHKRRRKLEMSYFSDDGREFLDKDDYKLADLDIFGSHSLYQYINVSKSKLGRIMLAESLKGKEPKDIRTRNSAKVFVDEKTLDLEASLLEFKQNTKSIDYDEYKSVLSKKIKITPLSFVSLLLFITSVVYLIVALINHYTLYPLILIVFATILSAKLLNNNEVFMLDAFKYYELSKAYLNVSKTILNLDYDDPYYNSLKDDINNNIKHLKNMEGLYLTLSSRRNLIFNLLLNVFAYDFFLSLVYNFKVKKVTDLTNLFESVAKIEVIASFAIIGIDNEIYSIPEESSNIEAKDIYHPLVKNCVPNDFKLEGGVILTGSNMSGKTTFMRTIGINQVLFNAGGLVCAKSFKSLYLPIYTSLRANDMLKEGISTFYAEILRMKKANEGIKEGKSLILIDEIFKGTNAYERISASFKVIDKFNEYKALFIISSHDFELCDAKNILNYHFSEYYNDDNKIAFDYKIKEGKCETKNALYLLKMANIID